MSLENSKITPLLGRVVVHIDQTAEKTKGGLYIPDVARQKLDTGIVTEVASDVDVVKVGDKVVFDKYAGTIVKIAGDDYNIIEASALLAVLEE